MKRFIRTVMRLFAFVQWLAAVMIATVCVVVQLQTLEDADAVAADFGDEPGGQIFGQVAGVVGPVVASASVTIPGLLLAILLMLSANYCDQAARPGSSHRSEERSAGSLPPDPDPPQTREVRDRLLIDED